MTITHVDYSTDNHSIYFRVGSLLDFRAVGAIDDAIIEVPEDEREALGIKAIFFSSSEAPLQGTVGVEDERETWTRLCDLLADRASPVDQRAKQAVYIRLNPPRAEGETVQLRQLFHSEVEGPKFGWQLRESVSYEVPWDHRIPALIDTPLSFDPVSVGIKSVTDNLELATHDAPVTGNYERHSLGLTARKPSGTHETLIMTPSVNESRDSAGESIYPVELRSILGVRKSPAYRLKRSLASVGALVIVTTAVLLQDKISGEGIDAVWSLEGLKSFLIASVPIVLLKIVEDHFKQ